MAAQKRRKVGMSFTVEPEMLEFINSTVEARSFSHRMAIVIQEWITFKNALVMYEDSSQTKTGEPTLINPNATRVYSCSAFFYGWDIMNCNYLDEISEIFAQLRWNVKRLPKSERLVVEKFLPLVRERGFDVQIVDQPQDDIYDVWIAPKFAPSKANCAKCKHLLTLQEYIDNALNDIEENIILRNLGNIYDQKIKQDVEKFKNDNE